MMARSPIHNDIEISNSTSVRRPIENGPVSVGSNTTRDAAAVPTVTFTVAAADPFNTTVLGETMHVDCVGAPAQVKVTV